MSPSKPVAVDGMLWQLVTRAIAFVTLVLASILHRLLSPRVSARRGSWLRRERVGMSVGLLWPANSLLPATPPRAGHFEELEAAEELLASLPALRKTPSAYRRKIRDLVPAKLRLHERAPEEAEELAERAALVCAFLAYAYLRAGAAELSELPKSLAAPWAEASAFLDRAVSLDYVSTVLSNCTVVESADDDEPAVRVDATFTGSDDERHFYAIHARVETAAAPAVRAITRELDAVEAATSTGATREDAAAALADVLREAARSVRRGAAAAADARRRSPQYFYGELRSQLAGFDAPVTSRGGRRAEGDSPRASARSRRSRASTPSSASATPAPRAPGVFAHRRPPHADRPPPPPPPPAPRRAGGARRGGRSRRPPTATPACARARRVRRAVAEFRRAHLALATSFIIRPAMRAAKPAEAPSPSSILTVELQLKWSTRGG